jgi:hypothetical protein
MSFNLSGKGNLFLLGEFLGSMLLEIASISPLILFYQILKTDLALASQQKKGTNRKRLLFILCLS